MFSPPSQSLLRLLSHTRLPSKAPSIVLRYTYRYKPIRIQQKRTIMSQSHACCNVPAVVGDGYKGKGEYITINGMKTYVTGPSDAKTALLVVYGMTYLPSINLTG